MSEIIRKSKFNEIIDDDNHKQLHSLWTSSDTVDYKGDTLSNTVGNSDISLIGDGTIKGAIKALFESLKPKSSKLIIETSNYNFIGKKMRAMTSESKDIFAEFDENGICEFVLDQIATYTISFEEGFEDYTFRYEVLEFDTTEKVVLNPATITVSLPEDYPVGRMMICKADNGKQELTNYVDETRLLVFKVDYKCNYKISVASRKKNIEIEELGIDYNVVFDSIKIVPFDEGTEEEIDDMIKAHYDDELRLQDYWVVGDTRRITVNAMSAIGVPESHTPQTVDMVIIDFEHDDLVSPINNHTKAAITIQQKDCLSKGGYVNTTQTNVGGWNGCDRRAWCNSVYKAALPSRFSSMIKTVYKNTGAGNKSSVLNTTSDDVFLLSNVEVFNKYSYTVDGEGFQYTYYKTSANIKKYFGSSHSSVATWWLRTPYLNNATNFCLSNTSNALTYAIANYARGLAPAFCM